jgi:hypothetical protein
VTGGKDFPGFERIYVLDDPMRPRFFGAVSDPIGDFPTENAVVRADVLPPSPVRFAWYTGGEVPEDFVWAASLPLLVSDAVVAVLNREGFVGWSTYEVDLYGKTGERIPGYRGFSVSGRCGPSDKDMSRAQKQLGREGVAVQLGLLFDPGTWGGSDIFLSAMPRSWLIHVTEDVKKALRSAKFKNVDFEPLLHPA